MARSNPLLRQDKKTGIAAAVVTYGVTAAVGVATMGLHIADAQSWLNEFWRALQGLSSSAGRTVLRLGFGESDFQLQGFQFYTLVVGRPLVFQGESPSDLSNLNCSQAPQEIKASNPDNEQPIKPRRPAPPPPTTTSPVNFINPPHEIPGKPENSPQLYPTQPEFISPVVAPSPAYQLGGDHYSNPPSLSPPNHYPPNNNPYPPSNSGLYPKVAPYPNVAPYPPINPYPPPNNNPYPPSNSGLYPTVQYPNLPAPVTSPQDQFAPDSQPELSSAIPSSNDSAYLQHIALSQKLAAQNSRPKIPPQ